MHPVLTEAKQRVFVVDYLAERVKDSFVSELVEGVLQAAWFEPHALFFILLPPLLFESSSSMSWHVLKKVLVSSYLLAWPGVLLNTALTGAAVRGIVQIHNQPPSWESSFLLGAVLSATDPVAVVAALKTLGAPAKLSTLVDGESLVNDGSAVVVTYVFMEWVMGSLAPASEKYCPTSPPAIPCVLQYFAQVACGGTLIGIAAGWLLYAWLLTVRSQHVLMQTTSILVVVYATCFIAEGLETSGVLATVSLGITSTFTVGKAIGHEGRHAHHMVLNQVAYLSNQIIFFIAGIITARFMFLQTDSGHDFRSGMAWVELGLIYVVIHASRAIMIALFSPALRRLGYGLSLKEGIILVVGGLRGAVALVMGLIILDNKFIDNDTKQMIAFHISGIVVLTLLLNGVAIETIYNKLHVYPANPYNTIYLRKMFSKIEDLSRQTGSYLLSKQPFFSDVRWHGLLRCVPCFRNIKIDANGIPSSYAIDNVSAVMGILSVEADVSGVVTTIGSNFEKRWLERRGSCAKILADLMHNTSGKLQRNDFMDHVAYSSEGVLQQVDSRAGTFISAQSLVALCESKPYCVSVKVTSRARSRIFVGLMTDAKWPEEEMTSSYNYLPECHNVACLDIATGALHSGSVKLEERLSAVPHGAIVTILSNGSQNSPITELVFSWQKNGAVERQVVRTSPWMLNHVFLAIQFHSVDTPVSRSNSFFSTGSKLPKGDVPPGLTLLFEPRPHADSQSINSFFRVLLNAIRKSFQDKFDHGLVGSQAYSWLMAAVDEATDCATQELNSRQVEDFMDEEMKAVHAKAGRSLLLDILQPILIEYLCLQKYVGHSTILDRVAEKVSAAKAFAYHTAKAKVETLWAFIETHEELLGTSVSIERYPALVECINRVIATARADLVILAETMPLRFFFSKHGMALRIILHNRVTQLSRAASKGWITDQEAEVLIGELQTRIREANNFYPRSTYIRLTCFRRCGPKFGAQFQKNAWDDFDLTLEPSFHQSPYVPEEVAESPDIAVPDKVFPL
ncbi:NHX7 [Symbiodinium natans]|uniref:NHX7 protein n=1 Tax=Symbiodinium natans TaxID=878477 RepID=A0A812R7B7_9DINO|nr:NHX7 [Symbiodinium natans]